MAKTRAVDHTDFAKRVERMCDFFLDRVDKNGSGDRKIIEDLKEDAVDIQVHDDDLIDGLHNYMKGS